MSRYASEPELVEPKATAEPLVLRAGLQFAAIVGAIEGYFCVLFSVFATLTGAVGCLGIFGYKEYPAWQVAASAIWIVGYATLDLPYVVRVLLIAIRHRHPFALTAARGKMRLFLQ